MRPSAGDKDTSRLARAGQFKLTCSLAGWLCNCIHAPSTQDMAERRPHAWFFSLLPICAWACCVLFRRRPEIGRAWAVHQEAQGCLLCRRRRREGMHLTGGRQKGPKRQTRDEADETDEADEGQQTRCCWPRQDASWETGATRLPKQADDTDEIGMFFFCLVARG